VYKFSIFIDYNERKGKIHKLLAFFSCNFALHSPQLSGRMVGSRKIAAYFFTTIAQSYLLKAPLTLHTDVESLKQASCLGLSVAATRFQSIRSSRTCTSVAKEALFGVPP
jgi:hypothetical protein